MSRPMPRPVALECSCPHRPLFLHLCLLALAILLIVPSSAASSASGETHEAEIQLVLERFLALERQAEPDALGDAEDELWRQISRRLQLLSSQGAADDPNAVREARLLLDLAQRLGSAGASQAGYSGGVSTGITGAVTESLSGLPVTNVTGVECYDSGGTLVDVDSADEAGEFQFLGLSPGTYFVRTRLDDYLDELWDDIACPGACDVTAGTPIVVTEGVTTTGVDFALAAGGGLSGTVTDVDTAQPIGNRLGVQLFDDTGDLVATVATGPFGGYEFAGIPTGSYYVKTEISGYVDELFDDIECDDCDVTTGTPVAVTVGMTTPGIDFALGAGGSIAGEVTRASDGVEIANAESLELYDGAGVLQALASTDELGGYEFGGLLADGYYVRTRIAGYLDEVYDDLPCGSGCDPTAGTEIVVAADASVTGIDIALGTGGSIQGVLTDSGTTLALANTGSVLLHDAAGAELESTVTDGSGSYAFSGLADGSYYVRTSLESHFDEVYDDVDCELGCDVTLGTALVIVGGSDLTDIDLALSAGGVVEGTVTEAGSNDPVSLQAGVQLYDAVGDLVEEVATAEDGTYRFDGLDAGTYYAKAVFAAFDDQLYDGLPCPSGCDVTTGTPVVVDFDAVTGGIDFSLGTTPIFVDGFESGDVTGWSGSVN